MFPQLFQTYDQKLAHIGSARKTPAHRAVEVSAGKGFGRLTLFGRGGVEGKGNHRHVLILQVPLVAVLWVRGPTKRLARPFGPPDAVSRRHPWPPT